MSSFPMPQQNTPPPQQQAPQGDKPDVAQDVMPIANQAKQAGQPTPGVTEAQMGNAPQARATEGPSKKRMVLSILGAAAGLGPMVQQVNQKHSQDQQIRNQHIIDDVWGAHNNETQARNRIKQLQPIAEDIKKHMEEAQALPNDDPSKIMKLKTLAGYMQGVTAEVKQQAGIIQASQTNLQALLADPKNRKILSKAVGYDEKNANTPERQQMIAAIQKSVPGTSPQEAQMESQFPQGASAGQPGLSPQVTEQVLKSATAQAQIEGRQGVADTKAATPQKETTDTRQRADFAAYQKQHPEYTGTEEQWLAQQKAAGTHGENRDDKYIAIVQQEAAGKPLTPDQKSYKAAYDYWVKQTKVAPGVARAAAFAANRYVPVVDPNNPENVILMRAGDAANAGANTPASIAFNTDKLITKYMTSGAGGQNINAFNTTVEHLKTLQDAATALKNGDIPAFNKLANTFATATGMPAPTDFNAVKFAVAGELSKTFKGGGATDAEISQLNTTINNAQSPAQIQGAIDQYQRLMGGKLKALQSQYESGKQGKPAFGGSGNSTQHKVGDIVEVGGRRVKITAIGKDGKATGVPVQ